MNADNFGSGLRHWWHDPAMVWRFTPMYLAMHLADLIARRTPGHWPLRQWQRKDAPGISVIVPERGTPELLDETLAALAHALSRVSEDSEVIVVVNGAGRSTYETLCVKYPSIQWCFHAAALGYSGAVAAGLVHARYPWTYLLNSDMRLEPDALLALLPYRQAQVFAIASQIFFTDSARRREETGWTDFVGNERTPQIYDRMPDLGELARGNLYAGGGSSLFRTTLLRRYLHDSRDYAPFYWEDVDWGVRAWSEGFEVLFCPTSHAWHHHRSTVKRYYTDTEIERVIARNALLFDLRHGWSTLKPGQLMHRIAAADARTRADLGGIGRAFRALRSRLSTRRAQRRGLSFERLATDRYYSAVTYPSKRRPRVLLVAPFALFPPAHGGARRIAELVMQLASEIDFFLLGDERSIYSPASEPWLQYLRATHLIEGRGDIPGEAQLSLDQRMERFAWPHMRRELNRLIALYDPDVVQIEFMELAQLAQERRDARPWLLTLHDVYLSGEPEDAASDARQNAALTRFDALTVCSNEDAALLANLPVKMIGNGAIDRRADYTPSSSKPRLLFMGPLRYAQNRDGLLEFLDRVWPSLQAYFPDLSMTVLGGVESAAIAATDARLRQPGIDLISVFVDPASYLSSCTLSINPQRNIRGSSIKLIESLLAGRVCISSTQGARGFSDAGLEGLVVASNIATMLEPIRRLLTDETERHRRERADVAQLDAYTWKTMAQRQLTLYRQLTPP